LVVQTQLCLSTVKAFCWSAIPTCCYIFCNFSLVILLNFTL